MNDLMNCLICLTALINCFSFLSFFLFIINPVKERDIDKKLLLWFDNCGCYKTAAIEHIMSKLGINVACLPPNMTAILQVLDLVVNGPLKAHIRNNRANKIVQCFKEYKALFDENARKDVGERAV
jgi:DDE superfamily endonuclease